MISDPIHSIVAILKRETRRLKTPAVGAIAETTKDPFRVLISCILSLRTRDGTTETASARLFHLAGSPRRMLALKPDQIERAIYPVSFYRNKTKQIIALCRMLLERFGGAVPDSIDALLTLPGVGRKTANLVVTIAYGKPGICVDTHVHRISNRLGYIRTRTPEESETALREKLPKEYWMIYNDLLVPYGQFVCKPLSPFCSRCKLADHCKQVGVERKR